MSNTLTHSKVSGAPPNPDAAIVDAVDWNAEHVFAGGAPGDLLVRHTGQTDGVQFLAGPVLNVKAPPYAALGNGVANDGPAINAAYAALPATGGTLVLPPGTYLCQTEVFLSGKRLVLQAYGATIITTGAISGLRVRGGGSAPISIQGLLIDHDLNAAALYGINIDGLSAHVRLQDCVILPGTRSGYAGVNIGQTDLADTETGAYWVDIQNLLIRKKAGDVPPRYSYGILMQGSGGNGTNIRSGAIMNAAEAIRIGTNGVTGVVPNGITVTGVDFERCDTAIRVAWIAGSVLGGHRFLFNRAETTGIMFDFSGTGTSSQARPPILFGNSLASDVTTYLNMPTAIRYLGLDSSITPDLGALNFPRELLITPLGGSALPIDIVGPGGGRGIHLRSGAAGSVQAVSAVWQGSGTLGRVTSGATNNLNLSTIRGISRTAVDAVNLRGAATLASAATVAVAFSPAEADASYFIQLTGNVNENFWVTSKATTGFTINSSNATSTATVDWFLVR